MNIAPKVYENAAWLVASHNVLVTQDQINIICTAGNTPINKVALYL